jgi:SAM-dependent methyltransferase
VVCCRDCGFVFADTTARQEDYDTFYARYSKYEDNITSTGGGLTSWDARRLQETAADIARSLPDRSARIVDIGCANGGLLAALKGLGFANLCGIDPSPACARYVRSELGIEAYAGSLANLPHEAGPADAVLLSHVLEHVRELRPALAAVRSIMKPGAILYAEVPDASRYAEFLFAPFQDFNTEHINHFSQESLADLLAICGFGVSESARKLLAFSATMPYPAIYAVGVVPGPERPSRALGRPPKDVLLRPAIESYIRDSSVLIEAIDSKIRKALEGSGPILVWGVGQLAMKLLAETSLRGADIVAFVDGNPIQHGKTIRGVPVLAPEQIRTMPQPILITTTLHEQEIVERITAMGLTNRVITLGNEQTA